LRNDDREGSERPAAQTPVLPNTCAAALREITQLNSLEIRNPSGNWLPPRYVGEEQQNKASRTGVDRMEKMSRSQLFCGNATSLKGMPTCAVGPKWLDDPMPAETDGPSNRAGNADVAPRQARVIDAPPLSRPAVTPFEVFRGRIASIFCILSALRSFTVRSDAQNTTWEDIVTWDDDATLHSTHLR
jgi:hypothetical protein